MSDRVSPARPAPSGRRRRRPPQIDRAILGHVRRALVPPLVLLAVLLVSALLARAAGVAGGWVLGGLVCGVAGAGLLALRTSRGAAAAVQAASAKAQEAQWARVAGVAAAVEKSVVWSADELCRGVRPPLPDRQAAWSADGAATLETALGELKLQAVLSLIRVHDESQSVVLLDVLRRLAKREHALMARALEALSELEKLTDDPELLSKLWQIDHLVTRMRRQVESTAILGGQSLRSVRRPVSVTTALRGAVSEVVQYSRVVIAAGSVGATVGLPGHVGPDLTHLLAELIDNSTESSDPATTVTVRAERVPKGLAVEIEDRAVPMPPQIRRQMNRLLAAPDEVDVSGQVRAGQLGLLVAAKIAQTHGLTVRLQENPTGGTTALVVIPARLLVEIEDSPGREAAVTRREAYPSTRPPQPLPQDVVPTHGPPSGQVTRPASVGPQGAGHAGASAGPPLLPRRTPGQAGPFRPPQAREQVPATAASPGLAAAFRRGITAGGTAAEQPGP